MTYMKFANGPNLIRPQRWPEIPQGVLIHYLSIEFTNFHLMVFLRKLMNR